MSSQINFLAERQKGVTKQQKRDLLFLRLAAAILGVACLGGLIIFGSFFYLSYQFSKVKDQEKTTREAINSNQETEAALVIYVKKLTTLATIYKDRQDK